MKFKLFGMDFTIKFSFAAMAAVICAVENPMYLVLSLLSGFIHEIGHLAAMFGFKADIKEITLYCAGIKILRGNKILPKYADGIILLGGCSANFTAFFILYFLPFYFCKLFAVTNLILGLINLLPLNSFDGGMLYFLISDRKIPIGLSAGILIMFTAVGAFFCITEKVSLSVIVTFSYFAVISAADAISAFATKNQCDFK